MTEELKRMTLFEALGREVANQFLLTPGYLQHKRRAPKEGE